MADFIELDKKLYPESRITCVDPRAEDHVVVSIDGHEAVHLHGDEAKEFLADLKKTPSAKDKPKASKEPEASKPSGFKPPVEK